jgi:hypothetical protein
MRLIAIFSVWDDYKLLRCSVENIRPLVDGILIIASTKSTHGEYSAIPEEWRNDELHVREPHFNVPLHSETDKRNFGLQIAREKGYTHFITMDADEFYKADEFKKIKDRFKDPNLQGIVCPCVTYFKNPTLTIGRDYTLVPHIHKLTPTIKHEFNKRYPFAWDSAGIRIDPTRSLNITSGVEYSEEIELHHMSWIRDDFQKKIRNSTARVNLERSSIRQDLLSAKDGYFCQFYQKTLRTAPDYFNLNELLDKNLLPLEAANQKGEPS